MPDFKYQWKKHAPLGYRLRYGNVELCCPDMSDAWAKDEGHQGVKAMIDHFENDSESIYELKIGGVKVSYCPWCGGQVLITQLP